MLEIIVETVEDAIAAVKGGATQLDILTAFTENGLTPSIGMVQKISSMFNTKKIMMLRPHSRSFILSPNDIEVMKTDIKLYGNQGVDGFVIGPITEEGEIDHDAIDQFRESANGLSLHLHLAWELTNDIDKTLEELIELGISSIRTNGGYGPGGRAIDGLEKLKKIQKKANDRIDIFLAGGVESGNIETLVTKTGIINAHAGSSVRQPPTPEGRVDEGKVRELRERLDKSIKSLKN